MDAADARRLSASRLAGSGVAGIFLGGLLMIPSMSSASLATPLTLALLIACAPILISLSVTANPPANAIGWTLWMFCLYGLAPLVAATLLLLLAALVGEKEADFGVGWALACAASGYSIFHLWRRWDEGGAGPAAPGGHQPALVVMNRLFLPFYAVAAICAWVGEGETRYSSATSGFYYITCLMPAFAMFWLIFLIYASSRKVAVPLLLAPPAGAILLFVGYANINA